MNNPKKIAVTCLCNERHEHLLRGRNKSIKKYLKYSPDVEVDNIIFEDIAFSDKLKSDLKKITDTQFANVWDNPAPRLLENHLRQHKAIDISTLHPRQKILGYKGMILFSAMEMWHYLKNYDYCIRLDADSTLHSPLNVDKFIQGGYTYGYIRSKVDTHEPTLATFPQAIKQYIRDAKASILCDPESDISCLHYYTNFAFMDLKFWRRPDVTAYLSHIYSLGGIEEHRWGDHVITANALRMFCPKEKIMKLDFKYFHESHGWRNFR